MTGMIKAAFGPAPATGNGAATARGATMSSNANDPQEISKLGEEIYTQNYRAEYEKNYLGQFVAINIVNKSATLGKTATEALTEAKKLHPHGFFHLIRVGHPGAFEVGLAYRNVNADRLHR